MHFGWLLAKGADWGQLVRYLVPLIVALIYAVNHIFNRETKTQPKAAKPAPRRIPTPPANAGRGATPPPGSRPGGPQQTDPLLAEIQKFLKQTSQGKAAPIRPQSPGGKPARLEPAGGRRGRPGEEPPARPLDSLAGRHLDTAEVGAGASHLIDDMKRGDAEREQHFEQTFSHKLGSLTDTSTGGAGTPPAPLSATAMPTDQPVAPSDWLTLRAGPEDLRRAIMLNEILQRHEDRW